MSENVLLDFLVLLQEEENYYRPSCVENTPRVFLSYFSVIGSQIIVIVYTGSDEGLSQQKV